MRTTRFIAALAVLAGVALLPGGCRRGGSYVSTVRNLAEDSTNALFTRRLEEEPLWFDLPGMIDVDVVSFGGDVTIVARPDLDVAIVTFTRRAIHGYGRIGEAAYSLGNITTTAEVVPGPVGPRMEVRATTIDPEPHFQRVDMLIEAPAVHSVRVRTSGGDVVASGMSGAVDIVHHDGNVRVMTPMPLRIPITVENSNGDIDYRVRAESTARFEARAIRGRVNHVIRHGAFRILEGSGHDSMNATLNDGDNLVRLTTQDGNVRIAVVAAPTEVGLFIRD